MQINLIAAMASNRVIGNKNALPWSYPEDLKHFRNLTTGHTIVMGSNTYLSIGRPLPNRRNIVLTKHPLEGIECYDSIPALMNQLEQEGVSDFFVIGGASIYQQFLDKADILYLTEIKESYAGDTYFPEFKENFTEISREIGEHLDFVVYKKLTAPNLPC